MQTSDVYNKMCIYNFSFRKPDYGFEEAAVQFFPQGF